MIFIYKTWVIVMYFYKKQDIYMVWKVYKMPDVICNIDKGFKLINIIEIDLASGQPSLLLNL